MKKTKLSVNYSKSNQLKVHAALKKFLVAEQSENVYQMLSGICEEYL